MKGIYLLFFKHSSWAFINRRANVNLFPKRLPILNFSGVKFNLPILIEWFQALKKKYKICFNSCFIKKYNICTHNAKIFIF